MASFLKEGGVSHGCDDAEACNAAATRWNSLIVRVFLRIQADADKSMAQEHVQTHKHTYTHTHRHTQTHTHAHIHKHTHTHTPLPNQAVTQHRQRYPNPLVRRQPASRVTRMCHMSHACVTRHTHVSHVTRMCHMSHHERVIIMWGCMCITLVLEAGAAAAAAHPTFIHCGT
jgi:hypothetical protein